MLKAKTAYEFKNAQAINTLSSLKLSMVRFGINPKSA